MSATTSAISIISFATVIGATLRIVTASFTLEFSIFTGIRNCQKTEKYNKIVMLARSKSNSIESKISERLTNSETSHEDFMTIIHEKKIAIIKRKH